MSGTEGSSWALLGFFATAFMVGLSGALMPGPVTTVTMAHVARRGAWAGPLVSTGHAIAEGALVAALALGASTLLASDWVTGGVAVLGAIVLTRMGWGMVGEGRNGVALGTGGAPQVSRLGPVLGGVLASVSNPYWFVWWSTVGVGYFAMAQPWGTIGVATFFAGHLMADFAWLTAIALALTGGRAALSDRAYSRLLIIMGIFLVILAAGFLLFGTRRLLYG